MSDGTLRFDAKHCKALPGERANDPEEEEPRRAVAHVQHLESLPPPATFPFSSHLAWMVTKTMRCPEVTWMEDKGAV